MKYLIIEIDRVDYHYYIVEELNNIIREMYEVELLNGKSEDEVRKYFFENYKVFEIDGEIKELKF